ncbi:MAG: hypothetical protein AAF318_17225 [Pseudomonadota bacterium]
MACTAGGTATAFAPPASGVLPDEPVLTNALALAPVPGAIASAGAVPSLWKRVTASSSTKKILPKKRPKAARGVELKWHGAREPMGSTSPHAS